MTVVTVIEVLMVIQTLPFYPQDWLTRHLKLNILHF